MGCNSSKAKWREEAAATHNTTRSAEDCTQNKTAKPTASVFSYTPRSTDHQTARSHQIDSCDFKKLGAGYETQSGLPIATGKRRRNQTVHPTANYGVFSCTPRSAEPQTAQRSSEHQLSAHHKIAGFDFPQQLFLGKHLLSCRGLSHLTYWGFQVCAAALYTPLDRRPSSGAEVMSAECPKRLQIGYLRAISAADLCGSSLDVIGANGLRGPAVDARIIRFNKLYRDVEPGDSYTLTYDPDVGPGTVSLALNGQHLGMGEGREFAHALFSVWFGEEPVFEKLKTDLLGGM